MKQRQTTKGRNSKKSKRPKKALEGGEAVHIGGCIHNYHHVADFYRVDRRQPGIAANLCTRLRPWAQRSLLGARVEPGDAYSS